MKIFEHVNIQVLKHPSNFEIKHLEKMHHNLKSKTLTKS